MPRRPLPGDRTFPGSLPKGRFVTDVPPAPTGAGMEGSTDLVPQLDQKGSVAKWLFREFESL